MTTGQIMKTISTTTFSLAILLSVALSAAAFAQAPAASATADAPAPAAAPAKGGKLSCDDLKQSIAAKLSSHGVKQYTLEVVDAAQTGDGKVVGQCDGGKSKVVYTKGASSTTASK
jgi:hypothetical protein